MMHKPSTARFFGIALLAVVMTALFTFLGAPIVRVLQNIFGSKKFWIAGLLSTAALWALQVQPMALLILSVWLTVGLYGEAESRGHANIWVAGSTIAIGTIVFCSGVFLWAQSYGVSLEELIGQGLENVLNQINAGKSSSEAVKIDPKTVLGYSPSAVILLFVTALAFALMLDRRTGMMLGLRFERVAGHIKLLDFKLPDFFVWIAMLSFLFSFMKLNPAWIGVAGTNVFNVMLGLYFFQGLAVLEESFLRFRTGPFTKFLIYFFIVGQLFILLSAVGFIDYWVDFRARMRRVRSSQGNTKNGEQI